MNRTLLFFAIAIFSAITPGARAERHSPAGFEFALIGDYNYGPIGGPEWQASERLVAAVNAAGVRFAVHLGDIESGGMECSDDVIAATRSQFARFRMPLVYVFGDNEWTDCHRYRAKNPKSPFLDPLERLGHLRTIFYGKPISQRRGPLRLERQADVTPHPEFRRFVENVRWETGGVLFVGLNVPGSNNNFSGGLVSKQTVKVPGQDDEWALRNAADIDWLRDSFRRATEQRARAVFLLWQANPDFEDSRRDLPHYDNNGYHSLLDVLAGRIAAFPGPVVLAHGDSHTGFRVDHPLPLANFVRVENYGHPQTHWTKVTVLPGRRGMDTFRFQGMIVPGNPMPPDRPSP